MASKLLVVDQPSEFCLATIPVRFHLAALKCQQHLALKFTIQIPKEGRNDFMKFHLYSVLYVVFTIPFSVFAETDNSKEDKTPKTKRSVWQRVFPRTGDIEGTVYQHETDTPLVGAEVHLLETDQYQKTGGWNVPVY